MRRRALLKLAQLFGALALVATMLTACVGVPIIVAKRFSPVLGIVASAASLLMWQRFGPRPMPGFLSGILCTAGYVAILATALVCAVACFR